MQKTFVAFFFVIQSGLLLSQNVGYLNSPCGLPMRFAPVQKIDSLTKLPPRIQMIANELLKESVSEFKDNITFAGGQIVDLEGWIEKDSLFPLNYQMPTPKYELYFELIDTSFNIQNYCIRMGLDDFGQIVRFDWPREGYNLRSEFMEWDELFKKAEEYSISKGYKTDITEYQLYFDRCNQRLLWLISFLQESTKSHGECRDYYKTIVLDLKSTDVIEETEKETLITHCY